MIEQGTSTGPINPGQDEEQEQELENWRNNFEQGFEKIYVIDKRKDIDRFIAKNPDAITDPDVHTAAVNTLNDYLTGGTIYDTRQAIALSETFLRNDPELFQIDEFKEMAKNYLTKALSKVGDIEPKQILVLKQKFLGEEPSLEQEFESAALTGLKDSLQRKKLELARQIIDIFLPNNTEVQGIVRESFLAQIRKGRLDTVEDYSEVFGFDPKEFKIDPDVIQAAETGTIESLQELAGMNKKFYPEYLKSAKEFYRYFFGQDKEKFLVLSQQALVTSLNRSFFPNAVYLKTKVLNQTPELTETEEIKKAAQEALERAQKEGYSPKDIKLITDNFNI